MAGNRKTDDLIVVGALMGAHGVRGEAKVKSFTEYPEDLFAYGPLLDAAGEMLMDPQSVRPAKDHFIVASKPVRSREDLEAMKGMLLHVPRGALPEPEEDEVYVEDLVGLSAITPEGDLLGVVKAVQNFGAGDLIDIAPEDGGKSVLIPFTLEDVPELDMESGRLVVTSWELWTQADAAKPAEPDS